MATIPQTTITLDQVLGLEGQYLPGQADVVNSFTSETDGLPAGKFVVRGTDPERQFTSVTALDDTAVSSDLLGLLLSNPLAREGEEAFDDGEEGSVLRKGRAVVIPEDAVTAGGQVHVRVVAAGAEVLGAVRGAADATDTFDLDLATARFETSAGAGEPAVISINLV